MNIELVYGAAFILTAFSIVLNISEWYRLSEWLLIIAAIVFGFALGWNAYDRWHGVF